MIIQDIYQRSTQCFTIPLSSFSFILSFSISFSTLLLFYHHCGSFSPLNLFYSRILYFSVVCINSLRKQKAKRTESIYYAIYFHFIVRNVRLDSPSLSIILFGFLLTFFHFTISVSNLQSIPPFLPFEK